jgi:hypothetical protein
MEFYAGICPKEDLLRNAPAHPQSPGEGWVIRSLPRPGLYEISGLV